MPIVTIHTKDFPAKEIVKQMIEDIQLQGAKALNCSPENIWVVFQPISENYYSKGPGVRATPIVYINALTGRSESIRTNFTRIVVDLIACHLSIKKETVWVYYHEMSPSQVWSQGNWMTKS
ncbi:MAG: tautomerase family protein [Pseudobdellovibrionaceae bacterium]